MTEKNNIIHLDTSVISPGKDYDLLAKIMCSSDGLRLILLFFSITLVDLFKYTAYYNAKVMKLVDIASLSTLGSGLSEGQCQNHLPSTAGYQ